MPGASSLTAAQRAPVVTMVASAGGLAALGDILAALPVGFAAPVVIGQHLAPGHSYLVHILRRRALLQVEWARDGGGLDAGVVRVCPPRMVMTVRTDERTRLVPTWVADATVLDTLLASLAASVGTRSVAVILTGMGCDGANGARAVHAAGGTVIVQDAATAAYPSMPMAALETGAVDLVLPVSEIGAVLAALAA